MVRFFALSTLAAATLMLPQAGLAGSFSSSALLAGGISVFGLMVALCSGNLEQALHRLDRDAEPCGDGRGISALVGDVQRGRM